MITPPKSFWPYALIGYFVMFISCIAVFISFALQQDVHLVRGDYYRAEVKYQEQLDRMNRTAQLGRAVVIEYSAKHRQLGIKLPATHLPLDPVGEVRLYRPNNPDLDQSFPLNPENNGKQFIDMADLENGSWRVDLSWQVHSNGFFKSQKIVIFNPPS
jgi:hypothetical protein